MYLLYFIFTRRNGFSSFSHASHRNILSKRKIYKFFGYPITYLKLLWPSLIWSITLYGSQKGILFRSILYEQKGVSFLQEMRHLFHFIALDEVRMEKYRQSFIARQLDEWYIEIQKRRIVKGEDRLAEEESGYTPPHHTL